MDDVRGDCFETAMSVQVISNLVEVKVIIVYKKAAISNYYNNAFGWPPWPSG